MMEPYEVLRGPVAESGKYDAFTLRSAVSDLSISFVPDAGMVGCSFRSGGVQLLGQRQGIDAFVSKGKTFGIPLLAPWANRLGSDTYSVAGVEVDVAGTPGMHRDANGYPIHGLVAGSRGWEVTEFSADHNGATLVAELAFDSHRMEFQAFPFPHRLAVRVHLPFTERAALDDHNLPTGEVNGWAWDDGALGTRVADDLFVNVEPGTRVSLSGGSHTLHFDYLDGYPYAVFFAPAEDDVVAIEPMTAPTDPFGGRFALRKVAPGHSYSATFAIRVEGVAS